MDVKKAKYAKMLLEDIEKIINSKIDSFTQKESLTD